MVHSQVVDAGIISSALDITLRGAKWKAQSENWPYTETPVRGGRKRLYALADLPPDVQVKVTLHLASTGALPTIAEPQPVAATVQENLPKAPPAAPEWTQQNSDDLWEWANSRTQKLRDEGAHRAALLMQVLALLNRDPKLSARKAIAAVAEHNGEAVSTLERWWYKGNGHGLITNYPTRDWAALMIPGYVGCTAVKTIPPQAWDWFVGYYLQRSQPTLADAYRRTVEVARAHGWGELPSVATFSRRLDTIPLAERIYRREGAEELGRIFPPQRRDKTVFAAGEAVSGDGLKFDRLWIMFPDGEILNTATGWFWQDIRTNKILAYRLAKTENTDLFRLATYDLVGITVPKVAIIDNTRVAANKAMTGRAAGRHRFKNKDTDPIGLLELIGINPQFTDPDKVLGSPGAKPIERAFGKGGIHDAVATHPRFINRGYSTATAIPYEEFAQVVAEEVQRYNTQPGRKTAICRGVLSFEDAFNESFSQAEVRRLSESQRNLLLLMPEVVRCDKRTGEIRLKAGSGPWGAHRYWCEALVNLKGEQVVVYYDPENLTKDVSIHHLNGVFVTVAHHTSDVVVNDTTQAREWRTSKNRFVKSTKKAAVARSRMDDIELGRLYPSPDETTVPEPGVVRPNFGQSRRVENGIVTGRAVANGGLEYEEGGLQPNELYAQNLRQFIPRRTNED